MTTPGPEQADLRVVALTAKIALSSAYSAFRTNLAPAKPTESITLRDGRHGTKTDVWLPSATR